MNPRDELELEEYLDGRLDEALKKSFEGRMAKDPELASRVAFHRELREVLREAPALPAGFALRARRRFEESRGAGPRRARIFLLPAAGLAVAALLVAVLVLDRESPESTFSPPARTAAAKPSEPFAPAPRVAPAAVPAPSGGGEKKETAVRSEARPEMALKAPEPASVAEEDAARGAADLRVARSNEGVRTLQKAAAMRSPTRCEDLPGDSAPPPGSSRVIDESSLQSGRESEEAPAMDALRKLGVDPSRERLVLIGGPCACSAVAVAFDPDRVRITVATADAVTGCAVAIPAGNSRVEIERLGDGSR